MTVTDRLILSTTFPRGGIAGGVLSHELDGNPLHDRRGALHYLDDLRPGDPDKGIALARQLNFLLRWGMPDSDDGKGWWRYIALPRSKGDDYGLRHFVAALIYDEFRSIDEVLIGHRGWLITHWPACDTEHLHSRRHLNNGITVCVNVSDSPAKVRRLAAATLSRP